MGPAPWFLRYRMSNDGQHLCIDLNQMNTGIYLAVTVTTRVERHLAEVIDEIARQEGMDRSTVVRRFLSRAVRDWLTSKSLERYEAGTITLWQAAEQCGLSLWETVEEARARKVHSPYSLEQLEEDLRAL